VQNGVVYSQYCKALCFSKQYAIGNSFLTWPDYRWSEYAFDMRHALAFCHYAQQGIELMR